MFGHLKAEDFVSLIEGGDVRAERRRHVENCERCRQTWKTLQVFYSRTATLDEAPPEPDWAEFRASVRDEMLSRSVQRRTAVRRWTGWSWGPAAAWSFSLMFAVGVTAAAFMWTAGPAVEPTSPSVVEGVAAPAEEVLVETQGIETEIRAWSNNSVFDDIANLESGEAENLLQLLETEGTGVLQPR